MSYRTAQANAGETVNVRRIFDLIEDHEAEHGCFLCAEPWCPDPPVVITSAARWPTPFLAYDLEYA